MLTTIFNHGLTRILLTTGLLLSVLGIETVPATGQMVAPGQFTSTSAQQAIYAFATNLSPYEQQLVVNALRKLGPQRAGAEVARLLQMTLAVPGGLSLLGPRVITPCLQSIPAQYHQAFVDGVFRVSLAEEQFSVQVMSRLMQAQQMQAGSGPQPFQGFPSAMGPGNFGSDGDPITTRDVLKWGERMNQRSYETFIRGQNMNPGMVGPD